MDTLGNGINGIPTFTRDRLARLMFSSERFVNWYTLRYYVYTWTSFSPDGKLNFLILRGILRQFLFVHISVLIIFRKSASARTHLCTEWCSMSLCLERTGLAIASFSIALNISLASWNLSLGLVTSLGLTLGWYWGLGERCLNSAARLFLLQLGEIPLFTWLDSLSGLRGNRGNVRLDAAVSTSGR